MRPCAHSPEVLRDILEWDVASWRRVLELWDTVAPELHGARVLEVGSRHGGLALYFALKGCRVVASDLVGPTCEGRRLHARYGVSECITYEHADAVHIPHHDGSFDVVAFKSVLGEVGSHNNRARQQEAVAEMHRVLRKGGRLLFAENTTATPLHGVLRRAFAPWGDWWRYLPADEVRNLFAIFDQLHVSFGGFCATLGRSERQRAILHRLDVAVEPIVPARWKYIVFGCATK